MKFFVGIYFLWNIITFFMIGIDKRKSQRNEWRISEKALLISAFLMGGVGSLVGSHVFHHKTKKLKFRVLLPLSVLCNCATVYIIAGNGRLSTALQYMGW